MSGSAQREHEVAITPSRRAAYRPSLSLIVLSLGDRRVLEGALAAVTARCRRMEAEVIVVRATGGDGLAALHDLYPSVTFVEAPADCADNELREIGIGFAKGDIVTLRADSVVGDGAWLSAFHATVGTVDDDRPVEIEVALAVSVEDGVHAPDRRRSRNASKRRHEPGRSSAGFADVAPLAPTLGSEM